MTTTEKGITVTGIEASSFHRLKFAQVRLVPGKGLVRVTGNNRAGKTSLLRSIRAALGGKGEILSDTINDESEDGSARITLTLSNGFTVTRRFTEAEPKGYLTVLGPDGGKHAQGKLADWLGPHSFDPLAFFQSRPERQREILLSLSGDPDLPQKLDDIRDRRARVYDERTPWISTQQRTRKMRKPDGERPEPIDTTAELRRIGELQAVDRRRGDARNALFQAETAVGTADTVVASWEKEIRELEEQLRQAREGLESAEASRAIARETAQGARDALDAIPDPAAEIEEIHTRIEQADAVHTALEPWRAWDRAQAELEEATQKATALTEQIRGMDADEKRLIAEAGLPVEGLTFDEAGAPLLNGHPLEVASGAERIHLAVAVALKVDPELRVCLVDEANDLDLDALNALDALGNEHGFQIWAARLGIEGPGEVLVVDGQAWDRDAERDEVAA